MPMPHGVFGWINHRALTGRVGMPCWLACAGLLAVAWLGADPAQALGRPEGRYYVDVGYAAGVLQPDTDNSHFSVRSEDTDGFKLVVGHVVNRNWGLEAFWTDLGTTVMAPDDSLIEYTEYGLMAVYHSALSGRWDVSIKLGAALLDVEWEHDFTDEGQLSLAGGISLRLPFRKFWWMDLGYDAYTRDASAVSLGIGRYFGLAPDWGQAWLATQDSGDEAGVRSVVTAAVDHESAKRHGSARQLAALPDRVIEHGGDRVSSDKIRTISIADAPESAVYPGVRAARPVPLADDAPATGGGLLRLARLTWGPYSNLERAQRAGKLVKRSVGARPVLARRDQQYWVRVSLPDTRAASARERADIALRAASLAPDAPGPGLLSRPPNVAPAPAFSEGMWRVQLASFADAGRAESLRATLAGQGYSVVLVPRRSGGRHLQAVQILVRSRDEAQRLKRLMDREHRLRSAVLPP